MSLAWSSTSRRAKLATIPKERQAHSIRCFKARKLPNVVVTSRLDGAGPGTNQLFAQTGHVATATQKTGRDATRRLPCRVATVRCGFRTPEAGRLAPTHPLIFLAHLGLKAGFGLPPIFRQSPPSDTVSRQKTQVPAFVSGLSRNSGPFAENAASPRPIPLALEALALLAFLFQDHQEGKDLE